MLAFNRQPPAHTRDPTKYQSRPAHGTQARAPAADTPPRAL